MLGIADDFFLSDLAHASLVPRSFVVFRVSGGVDKRDLSVPLYSVLIESFLSPCHGIDRCGWINPEPSPHPQTLVYWDTIARNQTVPIGEAR